MELTPQLLTDEIDFRIAVRGYDRNEVDDFLERVAVAVGQLQDQLAKAVDRARKAEAKLAAADAPGASQSKPAGKAAAKPAEPVVEPEVAAEPEPTPTPAVAAVDPAARAAEADDLNDELRRTLVLAQRTADAAVREAKEEAEQIRATAQREAQSTRDDAEAEARRNRDEARSRLVAEITELESVRESLRDDAGVLERYLGDERARVRETIQVLRRLVDDPKSFQVAPEPALSGARVPEELRAAPEARGELAAGSASNDAPEESSGETASPDVGDVPAADPSDAAEPDAPTPDATAPEASEEASPARESARESVPRPPAAPTPAVDVAKGPLPPRTTGAAGADAPAKPAEPASSAEAPREPGRAGDAPQAPSAEAPKPPTASSSTSSSGTGLFAGAPDDDLGRLFDTGEHASVDWRAGADSRGDQGPHTQPLAAARFEEEPDDAFLAELRRAMSDNEPLGPDDGPKGR